MFGNSLIRSLLVNLYAVINLLHLEAFKDHIIQWNVKYNYYSLRNELEVHF